MVEVKPVRTLVPCPPRARLPFAVSPLERVGSGDETTHTLV